MSSDRPSTEAFRRALATLEAAFSAPPRNDLERDGAIQRFEYTFELAWKAIRKHLLWLGRADVSGSPKPVLRDGHEEGLIDSVDEWFAYVEARNTTVHVYDPPRAEEVFAAASRFVAAACELLRRLDAS